MESDASIWKSFNLICFSIFGDIFPKWKFDFVSIKFLQRWTYDWKDCDVVSFIQFIEGVFDYVFFELELVFVAEYLSFATSTSDCG